jgi:predicted membrane-bound spermidine synthase
MTVVLIVLAAVVVAIGALVGLQLPELRRYMKMRKM